jgi:proteasome lid subunit RPN8/RPN11
MDPRDVSWALRDMARSRTKLGAIVHSHPRTPPLPSVTDLAEARFPGVISVIVGLHPRVEVRAWRLPGMGLGAAEEPEEIEIRVVPAGQDMMARPETAVIC